MSINKITSELYRAARRLRDLKAVINFNPMRLVNKIMGSKILNKLWRK